MSEELAIYQTDPMQLTVVVKGEVVSSNLPAFRSAVTAHLAEINRSLKSDEDFGQAELDVKNLKAMEKSTAEARERALEQAVELNELLNAMADIGEEIRKPRLELEKLIEAEKKAVKARLIADALNQIDIHPAARFAHQATMEAALKSKRTLVSMREALDSEVKHLNEKISKNRAALQEFKNANGTHLIPDEQALLTGSADILPVELAGRLAKFQKEEAERKAAKAIADERAASAERERLTQAEADKRIEAANVVAAATPADPLPFAAPPRAAAEDEDETEEEERARIVAAILSALGGLKPMLDAVKHAHNIAHVKAFRGAVNPAFQLLKKGGAL